VQTSFAEADKRFPVIKSGALGYLCKNSAPEQLRQAIRDVHPGKLSLDPAVALKLICERNHPSNLPLSERELEVLRLVARGLTHQEIADTLIIGEHTVGNLISSILSKLHLAHRTQAALYALREGIATLEETR
jgi:NarL family two-component system response regulator LiaR